MGVAFKFGIVALSACVCLALADPIPSPAEAKPAASGCADGQDSVECAQMQLYRSVRSFFDQDKIELPYGLSLIVTEKKGRSLQNRDADAKHVEHAQSAGERETALEEFTVHKVMRFFQGRTLHWNLSPVVTEVSETARSVVESIPSSFKSKISNYIEEGKYSRVLQKIIISDSAQPARDALLCR